MVCEPVLSYYREASQKRGYGASDAAAISSSTMGLLLSLSELPRQQLPSAASLAPYPRRQLPSAASLAPYPRS